MLIDLFVFLLPFSVFALSFGSSLVEPALFAAAPLAVLTLLRIASNRIAKPSFWFVKPFTAFLLICFVFLPFGNFGMASFQKGVVQIIGISTLLLTAIGITHLLYQGGTIRLVRICKTLGLSLGLIALLGCWQFIATNLLHADILADFAFLNGIFSKIDIWKDAGYLGGLHRTNSLCSEPAHYAQYLGVAMGLALARVGAFGRSLQSAMADTLPFWTSVLILVGVAASLSLVGYCLAALILLYGFLLLHGRKLVPLLAAACLVSLLIVPWQALLPNDDSGIVAKAATIPLIISSAVNGVSSVSTRSISSLALGANIKTAIVNFSADPALGGGLGSHPLAYAAYAPAWIVLNPALDGLNAQDGGSLLIRLISETGVVGTSLFLLGWFIVLSRATKSIRAQVKLGAKDQSKALAITIGITSSCFGLFFVYLFREGFYYAPPLWLLLGVTAAVPFILDEQDHARTDAK